MHLGERGHAVAADRVQPFAHSASVATVFMFRAVPGGGYLQLRAGRAAAVMHVGLASPQRDFLILPAGHRNQRIGGRWIVEKDRGDPVRGNSGERVRVADRRHLRTAAYHHTDRLARVVRQGAFEHRLYRRFRLVAVENHIAAGDICARIGEASGGAEGAQLGHRQLARPPDIHRAQQPDIGRHRPAS
jgi:hypothetical protein